MGTDFVFLFLFSFRLSPVQSGASKSYFNYPVSTYDDGCVLCLVYCVLCIVYCVLCRVYCVFSINCSFCNKITTTDFSFLL